MSPPIYKTITDYPGATGAMPLLFSIRDGIPYAFPVLLFAIFLLFLGGSYYIVKARTGRAKILISFLASSFFVLVLSIFLAMATLVTFTVTLFWAFLVIIVFIMFITSDYW